MQNDTQGALIAKILRKLADHIEQDPELAHKLSFDLAQVEQSSPEKEPIIPSFDVFEVYRSGAEKGLIEKLGECSIGELLAIVRTNSLDTTGKVRKWKTPEKVREFILERVSAKVSKGSVFDS